MNGITAQRSPSHLAPAKGGGSPSWTGVTNSLSVDGSTLMGPPLSGPKEPALLYSTT